MTEWKRARKKPVEVHFREVFSINGLPEIINTREGILAAYPGVDYIIMGIEGELYPIKKTIFDKTYEAI